MPETTYPFTVGQTIRCVNPFGIRQLHLGRNYTVLQLRHNQVHDESYVDVQDADGRMIRGCMVSRFVPAEEPVSTPVVSRPLEAGDVVRCVDDSGYTDFIQEGRLYRVLTAYDDDHGKRRVSVEDANHRGRIPFIDSCSFSASRFQHIET